jgi:hypothetical protein
MSWIQFATSFQVCVPGAVAEIFGQEALASNLGFIMLFNMPGSLFASPIAGAIRDQTGTWKWMIVFAGTCSLLGGVIASLGEFRYVVLMRSNAKTIATAARFRVSQVLLTKK